MLIYVSLLKLQGELGSAGKELTMLQGESIDVIHFIALPSV